MRKLFKFERDLAKQIKAVDGQAPRNEARTAARPRERPEGRRGRPGTGRSADARSRRRCPASGPIRNGRTCPVFRLPALSGSWEQCAEGLAHPFTGEARPFVFDHALAKGREDVVLVHLNHRLVQMSLRLLAGRSLVAGGPEEAAEPGHGPRRARLVPCSTSPWLPMPGSS